MKALWSLMGLCTLSSAEFLGIGAGLVLPDPGAQSQLPMRVEVQAWTQITSFAQVQIQWGQFQTQMAKQDLQHNAFGSQISAFILPSKPLHMDFGIAKVLEQRSSLSGDASWNQYWSGLGYQIKNSQGLILDLSAGILWDQNHLQDQTPVSSRALALKLSFGTFLF